jgi:hypothetical protein
MAKDTYPFLNVISVKDYMARYARLRKLFKAGTVKFLWLGVQ